MKIQKRASCNKETGIILFREFIMFYTVDYRDADCQLATAWNYPSAEVSCFGSDWRFFYFLSSAGVLEAFFSLDLDSFCFVSFFLESISSVRIFSSSRRFLSTSVIISLIPSLDSTRSSRLMRSENELWRSRFARSTVDGSSLNYALQRVTFCLLSIYPSFYHRNILKVKIIVCAFRGREHLQCYEVVYLGRFWRAVRARRRDLVMTWLYWIQCLIFACYHRE